MMGMMMWLVILNITLNSDLICQRLEFNKFTILQGHNIGKEAPGYLKSSVILEVTKRGLEIKFKFRSYKGKVPARITTRDLPSILDKSDELMIILLSPDISNGDLVYGLIVNPLNTQFDMLITPTTQTFEWDADWKSDVKITKSGWEGEIFIPYTISQSWGDTVGICFMRGCFDSTGYPIAIVTGLKGKVLNSKYFTKIGINKECYRQKGELILIPFVKISKNVDENKFSYGGDIKWNMRNSSFNFVIKPDFAEIEADKYHFDLMKTGIFLPEKRPFFKNVMHFINMPIPFGNLFYTRMIEQLDYGVNGFYKFKTATIFGLNIKSDSLSTGLLNVSSNFDYENLNLSLFGSTVYDNIGDKYFYTNSTLSYTIPNSGLELDGEIMYSAKNQSKQSIYSTKFKLLYKQNVNKLNFNLRKAHIGDFTTNLGVIYFRNINLTDINLNYTHQLGYKFLNYGYLGISLEKIFDIQENKTTRDYKTYEAGVGLLSLIKIYLSHYQENRTWNNILFQNSTLGGNIGLDFHNLNSGLNLNYSYGRMWGRKVEVTGLDIYTSFKRTLNLNISTFLYAQRDEFKPLLILTPFSDSCWIQFDLKISYRFKKFNFLRVFLERETFENTNTLNLMYEREFPDVNSIFYIVINSKYSAISKYFNLPSKKDFKWAIKLSYAFKI